MPPVDDPLARLLGRSVMSDLLIDPRRGVRSLWPILGGFELDLYMLFEGVQGLGGFTSVCQNRQFNLLKQLMHIGPTVNSYGTQLRNKYKANLLSDEVALKEALEAAYRRHGFHTDTPDFLRARGARLPDDGDEAQNVVVTRDTGVAEASAFLNPHPEATYAALRARMNPFFLSHDECNHPVFTQGMAGGPCRPSLTQLDIRLHIVREWYRDVTTRLDVYTALKSVPVIYHDLGVEVFTYLELVGAINFGVVGPDPVARNLLAKFNPGRKREVAIVGAGLAGLAATNLLRGYDITVTVLEARKRPGGRVATAKPAQSSAPVDLGAMIITGCFQNPLGYVAQQLGVELLAVDAEEDRTLFDVDGSVVPPADFANIKMQHRKIVEAAVQYRRKSRQDRQCPDDLLEDVTLGEAHQVALERRAWREAAELFLPLQLSGAIRKNRTGRVSLSAKARKVIRDSEERNDYHSRLFRWFLANLENDITADAWGSSLLHWDHSHHRAFEGPPMLVKGGFGRLIDGLLAGKKSDAIFRYSHVVKHIKTHLMPHNGARYANVKCETKNGEAKEGNFDAVIVTAPLGVLKEGDISFDPPLPAEKLDAIRRLGTGSLVKVILEFGTVFWSDKSAFGALRESVDCRGEHFVFWNMHKYASKPVLISLITDPSAASAELKSNKELQEEAMAVLRQCYPSAPDPKKVYVTRWSEDRLSRGASSHVMPGCHPNDYNELAARTADSPVLFAGEHTYQTHPGSAGSAYLSGYAAACRVLEGFGMVPQITALNKHMLISAVQKATQAALANAESSVRGAIDSSAGLNDVARALNRGDFASRPQSTSAANPLVQMTGEAVELSLGRFHRAQSRSFDVDET